MASNLFFSQREEEVITLLLEGKSNKQIAFTLGLSTRTVEYHLGKIYSLLQVTSRSEAILRLTSLQLRESTVEASDHPLRLSTVELADPLPQTKGNDSASMRRFPLKTLRFLAVGLIALTIIVFLYLFGARHNQVSSLLMASQPTPSFLPVTSASPTLLPSTALSAREQLVTAAQQLAAQYDQAVIAEMQNGTVETSQDLQSGKEVIHFTGNSLEKVSKLYDAFTQRLIDLNKQYLAVYLAQVQPTPFSTQSDQKATDEYYQQLVAQYSSYIDQLVNLGPTVRAYDPADGTYHDLVIGDAYAKGEVMGNAMQALHDYPQLGQIDQEKLSSQVRHILNDPNLDLTYQGIKAFANAPKINVAVFIDAAGYSYSVAIESDRMVGIEPPNLSHINVPALEVKPIADVRTQAEKFARETSSRFSAIKDQLQYSESSKGDIYFFRWDYRSNDWTGTSWALMPPFLQVGMSAEGKLVTYINTLDLY